MIAQARKIADKKVVIVDVGEDLRGKHSERFRSTIYTLTHEGNYQILVNFEGVKSTDSLGIGVLIMGMKQCDEHGGKFKILNVSPEIIRTLKILKIDQFFEVFDDETTAVDSFD
jgi:anti-anti-sigma factor